MAELFFNIHKLKEITGLSVRTIRYYVHRNLIPRPKGGGRSYYYNQEHLHRLEKIQQLSSQGVPLEEIRTILSSKPKVPPDSPITTAKGLIAGVKGLLSPRASADLRWIEVKKGSSARKVLLGTKTKRKRGNQ